MKKLMFATALVASAAAFADPAVLQAGSQESMSGPLNAISFEGYNANDTFANGATEKDEGGNDKSKGPFFYFQGDQNGSMVKTFGGENAAAPDIMRPLYFASQELTNNKYLELSTEGGILWRSINKISAEGEDPDPVIYGLGDPQPIAETGTYLDTLIQFTPSEDGNTPDYDEDNDKLVIWLNIDSSGATPVTNLMVRANLYDFGEAPSATATNFTLAPATGTKEIVAGEWYRLTLKAIPNVMTTDENGVIPAFGIYVDGVQMCATTAQFSAAMVQQFSSMNVLSEDAAAAIAANKLFPSLAQMGNQGDTPTLQGIGFKGSGALDDIVWTEEDPFPAPTATDFTLTWPAGLKTVSFTIGTETVMLSDPSFQTTNITSVAFDTVVSLTGSGFTSATKTVTTNVAPDVTSLSLGDIDITYFFPLTETADQDGTPEHPYEVANAMGLQSLAAAVEALASARGLCFAQTADIDMASAGPFAGIGTYNSNLTNGVPFCGTYDGQGHKISNVEFTKRTYAGIFNQVKGGTIKDLIVENISFPELPYADTSTTPVTTNEYGGAIIGNVGLGATLLRLEARGTFGSSSYPATHNVAGIAVRVCGGASNVVNGVTMLETLMKDCTNNATLYGTYTKAGGMTALTQDQNGVPNDYVLFDGCVNNGTITMTALPKDVAGRDGLAGILAYVSDGTKMQNCVNNGSFTSTLTNAKIGELIGWAQGRFLDDLGGNVAAADKPMIGSYADSYKDGKVSSHCLVTGFLFAEVANNVATTVLPPLEAGIYVLEGNVTDTDVVATLTAVGQSISFDTNLGFDSFETNAYTFAGTVASSGAAGFPVATTADGVITYTVGYFPRTATPGQDGTAANPFEIADVDDFQALQAATAADASYRGLAYKQIEDVNMSSAGEFSITSVFSGVFDGGNHAISNVQLIPAKQTGFFQKLANATVSNLTVSATFSSTTASIGGAIFAGDVTGTCRFEHVITEGSFSGTHNCSGMVGNDSAKSASTDITFAGCTNRAAVTTTYTKAAGLMNYTEKAGAKVTFVDCANEGNITCAGGASAGGAWAGGFMAYIGSGNTTHSLTRCVNTGNISATQDTATTGNNSFRAGGLLGNVATVSLTDCSNSGTISGVATAVGSSPVDSVVGGLVGYGTVTLAGDCSNSGSVGYTLPAGNYTFASKGSLVGYGNPTVSAGATITAPATEKPIGKGSCAALNFAEVDNGVATFCGADAITSNKTYNVMLDNAAAFQFGATAGDYVTLVNSPATYTGTCEGENPTVTTAASGLTVSVQAVMGAYTYVLGSAGGYPTYLTDAPAEVKAAYDTWKTANGADTNSEYENQFLVNAAPATVVPATALAITAIEQNETAGWDITVECTVQGIDLGGTVGTARVGNGYLAVSYTADLTGTWTTENIAITASAGGKVTVNVNKSNAKFMKVKLSPKLENTNQN